MNILGGKHYLAKRLIEAMQRDSGISIPQHVLELCSGGGNVTWRLADWAIQVTAIELHAGLVALMNDVQGGWIPPTTCTRELRESCRDHTNPLHAFYRFGCGYMGAWDASFVPDAPARVIHHRSGRVVHAKPDIRAASASRSLLKQRRQNVHWVCADGLTCAIPPDVDLIYIDPPYKGTRPYPWVAAPAEVDSWWRRASTLATLLPMVPVYMSEESNPPLGVQAQLIHSSVLGQRRHHAGGGERVELLWRLLPSSTA